MTLYVTEPGAGLHKHGDAVRVEKQGALLAEVEAFRLTAVALYGPVQCSAQSLGGLLADGVSISWFSGTGRFLGRLEGHGSRNAPLRLAQYRMVSDEAVALPVARILINAKLEAQRELLLAEQKNHNHPAVAAGIQTIAMQLAEIPGAGRESLLGHEGSAARALFAAVAALLPETLGFDGRHRHPAPDPVNAFLSFVYTIFGNELASMLVASGFDPQLGFFHRPEYGRESLALDLLELFRPRLDRLMLRSFKLREFGCDDFVMQEEGCRFTDEALKRFFPIYERFVRGKDEGDPAAPRIAGLRREARDQIRRLAAWLRGEIPFYDPAGPVPVEDGDAALPTGGEGCS